MTRQPARPLGHRRKPAPSGDLPHPFALFVDREICRRDRAARMVVALKQRGVDPEAVWEALKLAAICGTPAELATVDGRVTLTLPAAELQPSRPVKKSSWNRRERAARKRDRQRWSNDGIDTRPRQRRQPDAFARHSVADQQLAQLGLGGRLRETLRKWGAAAAAEHLFGVFGPDSGN